MKSFSVLGLFLLLLALPGVSFANSQRKTLWQIQSIDTMKYSRDLAREKAGDPQFLEVINNQIDSISDLNVTHIAVGTPYDDEFVPFLNQWVLAIRSKNLNVWFRGNWSGWEKWFNYPTITRSEHISKTNQFISTYSYLFQDGDIFSSCHECENGASGDPRNTGDITGYRTFLIDEYNACIDAFAKIGKNVSCSSYSMNGDVAKLIMDKETTEKLGGIVTLDHYVKDPNQLAQDIREIANISGGKIILGEIGVPIPDIHGEMTESEQSDWLLSAINNLYEIPQLIGVNYWVNQGGSTALWDQNSIPKSAVEVIKQVYSPTYITGLVVDKTGKPINNVTVTSKHGIIVTQENGSFSIPYVDKHMKFQITKDGYIDKYLTIADALNNNNITLQPAFQRKSFFNRLLEFIFKFFSL